MVAFLFPLVELVGVVVHELLVGFWGEFDDLRRGSFYINAILDIFPGWFSPDEGRVKIGKANFPIVQQNIAQPQIPMDNFPFLQLE